MDKHKGSNCSVCAWALSISGESSVKTPSKLWRSPSTLSKKPRRWTSGSWNGSMPLESASLKAVVVTPLAISQ